MRTCWECDRKLPPHAHPLQKFCGRCRGARDRARLANRRKPGYRRLADYRRPEFGRFAILAKTYVAHAVSIGLLPRLDGSVHCIDCGKKAMAYEHRDYFKPMDVVPACSSCNARRGPALNAHTVAIKVAA